MDHDKEYVIRLSGPDLGQVIDGLEARTAAWRHTASYLETGEAPDGVVIEVCEDAEEARRIAERYELILGKLIQQQREQRER